MLHRYDTPQEYIDDFSISRLYAGVHYRFSIDAGRNTGIDIGKVASQRYFTHWRNRNLFRMKRSHRVRF